MHRSSPADTLHRSYDSGGSRTIIDKVDDGHMMQEMAGNFMKGESRKEIEAPQNYGFSSVVRPAKKGQDGQIEESAEGFISFMGGNRSFPVCTVMDDRRYRPWGLKPGENSQYDDLGQMTLLRRSGVYILSLDSEDDSEQDSSDDGATAATRGVATREGESGGNGNGQTKERFVSVRHVEKKKQDRPQSQSSNGNGSSSQSDANGKDHKHEGETVNLEMRVTKKRIEFRSGEDVVGYYDKENKRWSFTGEMRLGSDDAEHPVYGVNGGVGNRTISSGEGAVLVDAPLPGPPTALDSEPFKAMQSYIAALEQRVAALEQKS